MILRFVTGLFLLVAPLSSFSAELGQNARKNGSYFTCNDGRASNEQIFNSSSGGWWTLDLPRNTYASRQLSEIRSSLFKHGAIADYKPFELRTIFESYLTADTFNSTAYTSTGIKFTNIRGDDATKIFFVDSRGAKLEYLASGRFGTIIDAQGKQFEIEIKDALTANYCPPNLDIIIHRIVELIGIKVYDQYGNALPSPLIFVVTDMHVKTQKIEQPLGPSL